ncbi:OB-fold domain-containing protein [Rhodococcus sp. T2V]|uniref:Zn-ribbon domain-containing OB-fold protein n=1 Tax=Rhodococcus sp. T2V TaxID=3034164 RepID=UPI0023E12DEA|nr:OB-fold domain-containing protein [Rhodococcus sp. T2V]MDF3312236.1 OB-fold domain-containing protein [Rhodococcus sp. T2V]
MNQIDYSRPDLLRFPPPAYKANAENFWIGLGEGEIRLPYCQACDRWTWYPAPRCTTCGRASLEWRSAPTIGSIFSYTRVRRNFLPTDDVAVPYVVALVELDGVADVRLVMTVPESKEKELRVAAPVKVVIDRSGDHPVVYAELLT